MTMQDVSFPEICKALKGLELPACQLVVGIGEGGIVPAALVASIMGCDLKIVRFNYRNENNLPQHHEPLLLNAPEVPEEIMKILLVDDIAVSGKTLNAAKKLFKQQEVATMVFAGRADYVLFPEIHNCLRWPWKL